MLQHLYDETDLFCNNILRRNWAAIYQAHACDWVAFWTKMWLPRLWSHWRFRSYNWQVKGACNNRNYVTTRSKHGIRKLHLKEDFVENIQLRTVLCPMAAAQVLYLSWCWVNMKIQHNVSMIQSCMPSKEAFYSKRGMSESTPFCSGRKEKKPP